MRTNYLLADIPAMRGGKKRRPLARRMSAHTHVSLDDLLKQYPFSTVNEYGERVISGKRIC